MLALDQDPLLQANLEPPLHQPHLRAGTTTALWPVAP